jgi:PAS domain S-box-containing protein
MSVAASPDISTKEGLFEALFKMAPNGLILTDAEGKIVLANVVAENTFGYSPGELTNQRTELLVPPESREQFVTERGKFMSTSCTNQQLCDECAPVKGLHKSGTQIPLEVGKQCLRLNGEKYMLTTMADTTRRLKQERQLQAIMEFSPCGFLVVDAQFNIKMVNTCLETMFGYEPRELIGQPLSALIPESRRVVHGVLVNEYTSLSSHSKQMGAGREVFGRRKDGAEVPVEIGLNTMGVGANKLVVATVIDIGPRKRLEREHKRKDELIVSFFGHQVRNPLHMMDNTCDEMLSSPDLTPALRQGLTEMKISLLKMNQLTRDALYHHEVSTRIANAKSESLNIRDALAAAVRTAMAVSGVQISVGVAPQVPEYMVCDAEAVQLLLSTVMRDIVDRGNVLSPVSVRMELLWTPNCTACTTWENPAFITRKPMLDACFQKTREIMKSVQYDRGDAAEPEGEWWVHAQIGCVLENSTALSDEAASQLLLSFDPSQAPTSKTISSTSLRWAIIRQLAVVLNARIGLIEDQKQKNVESLFFVHFRIPKPTGLFSEPHKLLAIDGCVVNEDGLLVCDVPDRPTLAVVSPRPDFLEFHRQPRILVVDDEAVNRRVNERLLKKLGFNTQSVSDGKDVEAALKHARDTRQPFDAILLDIIMKHTHGDEVCQQLRKDGCTLPIIAATGNASRNEKARYLQMGFSAVLCKPFDAVTLQGALASAGIASPRADNSSEIVEVISPTKA